MLYIGIDIGGTKCSVSFGEKLDGCMVVKHKHKFATAPYKPEEILERFACEINNYLRNNVLSASDISGIGISCGGPLDSKRGVILSPPNLPGWDNIHIVDYFRRQFNASTNLQNDANACAIAEWKYGAGKGYENVIFMTFGTGIGAGLILSGHLYSGTNDMAGETGHIRITDDGPEGYGKAGSLEGYCSGGGIGQIGRMMVDGRMNAGMDSGLYQFVKTPEKITAKLIAELAENGDELCRKIYRISGEKLGQGLSILIDLLNPEIIIIGSIFTRSYDLLWDSTRAVIERETLQRNRDACKIVKSELGDDVGDYAALSVATGEF